MLVDLAERHFITIEDLLELIIHALRDGKPFGLTRWADSSNWVLAHGEDPVPVMQYREGYLTRAYFPEFKAAFMHGAQTSDVLGVFANDLWTKQIMNRVGLDVAGKKLVFAWCNKHINSRREWTDEVLGKPWRTALIGNRMPDLQPWLAERFPLEIVECNTATDWPEVKTAMDTLRQSRPQLAILCAGWYTSCLVGAAKEAGAVALSCGHLPDYYLGNHFPPNTEFPPGIEGNERHALAHFPDSDWIAQSREIQL